MSTVSYYSPVQSANEIFLRKFPQLPKQSKERLNSGKARKLSGSIKKPPLLGIYNELLNLPGELLFSLAQIFKPARMNPMCRNYGHSIDRHERVGINARCRDCGIRIHEPGQLRKSHS